MEKRLQSVVCVYGGAGEEEFAAEGNGFKYALVLGESSWGSQ